MQDFHNLKVWEKAHALTLALYRATAAFPKLEQFGLTSQVRRSSSSIPRNIAEGCGRGGDPEFGRFLQIAMGSASELEYQIVLARELEYLPLEVHTLLQRDVGEVKRMLAVLIQKVRRRHPRAES